jgi:hypothetical protein
MENIMRNDNALNNDDGSDDDSSGGMSAESFLQTLALLNGLRRSGFVVEPIFANPAGRNARDGSFAASFMVDMPSPLAQAPEQQHTNDQQPERVVVTGVNDRNDDDDDMPQLYQSASVSARQQAPPQHLDQDQAVEEAMQRSFALHQPYDWHMTLDNPAENKYMDLDAPLYTCHHCHATLTTGAMVQLLSRNQSLRCATCNNDELECFCSMLHMVVNQSFHKIQVLMRMKSKQDHDASSLSSSSGGLRLMTNNVPSLLQDDKKELDAMRDSIDDLFVNELVLRYPLDEDGSTSSLAQRECCIPMCDGKGRIVYCCPHHAMHIDCLMMHIIHADKELCPLCRDPFIMMMFYRIVAPRMHSQMMLGDSPYAMHPAMPLRR